MPENRTSSLNGACMLRFSAYSQVDAFSRKVLLRTFRVNPFFPIDDQCLEWSKGLSPADTDSFLQRESVFVLCLDCCMPSVADIYHVPYHEFPEEQDICFYFGVLLVYQRQRWSDFG